MRKKNCTHQPLNWFHVHDCFGCRYTATWRTPSSTSTRPRTSRSSSTWRWAPSWPPRPGRATPFHIHTPPASRWPPCRSWGTDTWPRSATAATPTALLPCSLWPTMTARWVEKESIFEVSGYMELKLREWKCVQSWLGKNEIAFTGGVTNGQSVGHNFCKFRNTFSCHCFTFLEERNALFCFHSFNAICKNCVSAPLHSVFRWDKSWLEVCLDTQSTYNITHKYEKKKIWIGLSLREFFPSNHLNKVMPLLISPSFWCAHQ